MNDTLLPKQKKPLNPIEEVCKLIKSSIESLSGKTVTVTSEIELTFFHQYNFTINYLGKAIHFGSLRCYKDTNQISNNSLLGFKQYFSFNIIKAIPKLEEWELELKANQLICKHPLFIYL